MMPNDSLGPLFEATVQATEGVVIMATVAVETMTGEDGRRVIAVPHDRLVAALKILIDWRSEGPRAVQAKGLSGRRNFLVRDA